MAIAQKGELVLLKIKEGTSYVPILSAKSNNFTINNATVDVSTKSAGSWGVLLSGGGAKEMTVSLEGVYHDETYDKTLRALGISGDEQDYEIVTSNGDKFAGKFVITSYTCTGARGEAETYQVSLRNSGVVTYTPIV